MSINTHIYGTQFILTSYIIEFPIDSWLEVDFGNIKSQAIKASK